MGGGGGGWRRGRCTALRVLARRRVRHRRPALAPDGPACALPQRPAAHIRRPLLPPRRLRAGRRGGRSLRQSRRHSRGCTFFDPRDVCLWFCVGQCCCCIRPPRRRVGGNKSRLPEAWWRLTCFSLSSPNLVASGRYSASLLKHATFCPHTSSRT